MNTYKWLACIIINLICIFSFSADIVAQCPPDANVNKVALCEPTNGKTSVDPSLVKFDWQGRKDPDGDHTWHQLQISTNLSFTTMVFNHGGGQEGEDHPTYFDRSYFELPNSWGYSMQLQYNTLYYWRVKPWWDRPIGNGEGEWSDIWHFTTKLAPPSKPTLIEPNNGANGISTKPKFSWSATSNTDSYTLKIYTVTFLKKLVFNKPGIGTTNYSLGDNQALSVGTLYEWEVIAVNRDNSVSSTRSTFATNKKPVIDSVWHEPHIPELRHPVVISAKIMDEQVPQASIFYRNGGEIPFKEQQLTAKSGNAYEGTILETYINAKGLQYYIFATDNMGLTDQSILYSIQVKIPNPGITYNKVLQSGDDKNSYRIISFPMQISNASPKQVLSDDLGDYHVEHWRFYQYGPFQQLYEYKKIKEIEPGRGYWLIVADEDKRIDTGEGTTIPTSNEFNKGLHPGYNLIGIPFNFPVPIQKVYFKDDPVVPELLNFNGSWRAQTDSLRPFQGYALFTEDSSTLVINPNFSTALAKHKPLKLDWSLQIIAKCSIAEDSYNIIGTSADASKNWDPMDYPEPPVIGNYVTLYFPHPDWGKIILDYCRDIRPTISELEEWPIVVKANTNDKIDLKFEEVSRLPPTLQAILIDENAGITINLRSQPSYSFRPCNCDKPSLRLIIGTTESMQEKMDEWNMLPRDYSLLQNYPNPFNPLTTIVFELPKNEYVTLTIMNALGQQVAVLAQEELYRAGRHALVWDARNTQSERVGSGEYFYKIRAGNFTKINKMILLQ